MAAAVDNLASKAEVRGYFQEKLKAWASRCQASPGLFPLSQRDRDWSLTEKYAVLAAVHDCCGKAKRIDPFGIYDEPPDDPRKRPEGWEAGVAYAALVMTVRQIEECDEPYLKRLLNEVAADVDQQLEIDGDQPKSEPTGTGGDDRWAELRPVIEQRLKGKQRRVVEEVITHDGRFPISDLATIVGWNNPPDNFNSAKREINKKLEPAGWELSRHGGAATLSKMTAT